MIFLLLFYFFTTFIFITIQYNEVFENEDIIIFSFQVDTMACACYQVGDEGVVAQHAGDVAGTLRLHVVVTDIQGLCHCVLL